jgi:large subunit ribosomal protein L17
MLANLACSLVKNGSVRTTDAKAKEVRPIVERMVTFAKRGDLHARRIVLSRLRDTVAVKKLFDEYGPKYADRLGGYTRILKLGFRSGDNSPISLVEFVGNEKAVKKTAHKAKTPVKRAARRKAGAGEPETVETPAAKESAKAEPVEEKAE